MAARTRNERQRPCYAEAFHPKARGSRAAASVPWVNRRRPRHGRDRGLGREAQGGPAGGLDNGQAAGVGVEGGVQDLMAGHPGLDQDAAAGAPSPDHAGGAGQQAEGGLGRPVAGGQ